MLQVCIAPVSDVLSSTPHGKMKTAVGTFLLLLVINGVVSVEWKHSAVLDNNFLVLWTPDEKDVTFEIQVKTLGYVGLGFTKDDGRAGADMVIGWVDNNGQVHLQVSIFLYQVISDFLRSPAHLFWSSRVAVLKNRCALSRHDSKKTMIQSTSSVSKNIAILV